MNYYEKELQEIIFDTLSGKLIVTRKNDLYEMDFPAYDLKPIETASTIIEAINIKPVEVYIGRDLLCVLDSEETVKNLSPNMEKLKELEGLLFHVTAKGKDFDCVSRSFAPKLNVPEDSVCGSGHCHIIPYWASRLNKTEIKAFQASTRSGILYCQMKSNRVKMSGNVSLYSIAELFI